MRIGLTGGGSTVAKMVEQAKQAEADGFTSVWYAGAIGGDPLAAMTLAGAATTTIELGTSVVQTYTCHPALQAQRALAVASAIDRPGFTLGIGPSHAPAIEGSYGMDYRHVGRHTEEYVKILAPLLRGEAVDFDGADLSLHSPARPEPPKNPVPLLLAALGPRLLRVAGELTDGTILWMGNARAIETHVAPRIRSAAEAADRPEPRIVAGLPIAVHDDIDEARGVAAQQFAAYGQLPNYRRLLDHGATEGPATAAIVGNEESVAAQIQALFDAGATDFWAGVFPVGADRAASRARTNALLKDLVS